MIKLLNSSKLKIKLFLLLLIILVSLIHKPELASNVQATSQLSNRFTQPEYLSNKITLINSYRDLVEQKRAESEILRYQYRNRIPLPTITPKPTATPTPKPIIIPTPQPTIVSTPRATPVSTPQSTIKPTTSPIPTQTAQPTQDSSYYSNQQLFDALNGYRLKNGKTTLHWSQKLADFAKTRTNTFVSSGQLDNHAGFNNYIHNQNGFAKLGFRRLGENSSVGYTYSATELIEKAYGQSPGHNSNQLGNWSHVGISANGSFTNFIFGGN